MSLFSPSDGEPLLSRRSLLVGGAVAGGLLLGWQLWPREYSPNLVAAKGETILGGYIKIGADGHVTVVTPQIEMGQGSYTLVAQIIADELGADWRTIGVEPAPLNPLYANALFASEWHEGFLPEGLLQVTGGSSTVRNFEPVLRNAGAAARTLLCKAAAARWDASWQACDTAEGFVTRGDDRLRFGELAADAATYSLPAEIPLRTGRNGRLSGRGVNRLDIPAKLDGSANYTADVRLPAMVFAAIRQGPIGDSRLISIEKAAANSVGGVLQIVEHERWVAVIATNWWAANHALGKIRPRFETKGGFASDAKITASLKEALAASGTRMAQAGDVESALGAGRIIKADYSVGLTAHAATEPLAATAVFENDRLQLWVASQAPGLARKAAAQAIGIDEDQVDVHAMMIGGSFGRKYEVEIAAQVAVLALKIKRPVQLIWSRAEDLMHDRFRPAARASLTARIGPAGQLEGWLTKIAVPDAMGEMRDRIVNGTPAHLALSKRTSEHAVEGAVPPYAIAHYGVDHHPADIGVATGKWRSGAHSYTAFFTESFIDELAKASGVEAFSFRLAALRDNPRLAACLTKVTAKGGWQGGGEGTGQGLACHSMLGGHIALLAEAQMSDDRRVRVTKLICVADVGRVINPDIARQQIEGGLLFGMAAACGNAINIKRGVAGPLRMRDLGLPLLADMPEISVELIISNAPPAGVGEIAVPPVAPAIANALFASNGQRYRSLPLAPVSL